MPCTPKQAEASRSNSLNSTGSNSAEGKDRSKFNAVRHGLDAKSLVIPGEDTAEAQEFFHGIVESLAPRDEFEADLCAQMARLSWKLMRAERVEQTVIRGLMERAHLDDKARREVEIHQLLSAAPETVRNVRSQLEESAEGCRWMIENLAELDQAVAARRWRGDYENRLDLICGSPILFRIEKCRAVYLSRCINSGPPFNWPPDEEAPLFDRQKDVNPDAAYHFLKSAHESRVPAWQAELRQILADRVAELEALRDLRLRETATERASVAELAPYAAHPSLERVREAIRSAQHEQARLRTALDAHRAAAPTPAPDQETEAGTAPETASSPQFEGTAHSGAEGQDPASVGSLRGRSGPRRKAATAADSARRDRADAPAAGSPG